VIVFERNTWEPQEVYYFRSHHGRTPICEVAKCGDWWVLWFYRGSANPGPYWYRSFEKAKHQVMRYLVPREERLAGELIQSAGVNAAPTSSTGSTTPLHTVHPSRLPRRKRWWADT
jgi:hypothetical protein